MKTVLSLTDTVLPITQTFIYERVRFLKKYHNIFLTGHIENADVFKIDQKDIIVFPFWMLKNKFYHESIFSKSYVLNYVKPIIDLFIWKKVVRQIKELIKDKDIRILHADFGTNGFGLLKLKKALGLPMVTSFYGYDVMMIQKQKPKDYYTQLFKEGDFFETESHFLADHLVEMGCPREKIRVVYLGIEMGEFKFKLNPLKKGEEVKVLVIGRMVEKKGIEYAIRAFAESLKKHPNLRLRIVGDGPLRGELERLVSSLGIIDKVEMPGYKPYSEIIKEMTDCHIFMLPSVTAKDGDAEGQGAVFLQASAVGRPVLSTLHDGIPQAVINGKSGFLVAERDYMALSEKLDYLIEHPKVCIEMGKFGRKHVEKNFDVHKKAREFEEIYDKFVK